MRYLLIMLFSFPCVAAEWGRYAGMPDIQTMPFIAPPTLFQVEMARRPDVWALEMKRRQEVYLPPAPKGDFVRPPNVGENRPK